MLTDPNLTSRSEVVSGDVVSEDCRKVEVIDGALGRSPLRDVRRTFCELFCFPRSVDRAFSSL